jgi:hypothetical protein
VIGSVYASLYASRLTSTLPAGLPAAVDRTAHASVGAALTVAGKLARAGHPTIGSAIHGATNSAFFHGFSTANYLAAGVAAAGAVMALAFLPAHPATDDEDVPDARAVGTPATASAGG